MSSDTHNEMKLAHQTELFNIEHIPVLPAVASAALERIQSPNSTITELSDLIRADLGLSSKIIRLANSSYYSIPGGCESLEKAFRFLGFNTIAQVVLTTSVLSSFKTKGLNEFPLSHFWEHSFAVGLLHESVLKQKHPEEASAGFIAGLLHDVGKITLLELAPENFFQIIKIAKENQTSFFEAESQVLSTSHIELGIHLCQHWGFPEAILKMISDHHLTHPVTALGWSNQKVKELKLGFSGDFSIQTDQQNSSFELQNEPLIIQRFLSDFERLAGVLHGAT